MNVKIGNRQQIAAAALQVPEGEDAWVEFVADGWNVRLNVRFVDNKDDPSQKFTLEAPDDHAALVFQNWNQALPGALPKPFLLGETNGRKVSFIFSGYAVQGFKFLNLSFFWEE